jgi:thiol-disulfide isomerase/thioredoxin
MQENYKYLLLAVVVVGILYLLYRNRSESLVQSNDDEQKKNDMAQKSQDNAKLGVYYTEWCGYSRRFNKDLDDGLENDIKNLGVSVERVDCEKNKNLCETLRVPGYPTVLLHTNDKVVQYQGDRSRNDLLNFIGNNLKK